MLHIWKLLSEFYLLLHRGVSKIVPKSKRQNKTYRTRENVWYGCSVISLIFLKSHQIIWLKMNIYTYKQWGPQQSVKCSLEIKNKTKKNKSVTPLFACLLGKVQYFAWLLLLIFQQVMWIFYGTQKNK